MWTALGATLILVAASWSAGLPGVGLSRSGTPLERLSVRLAVGLILVSAAHGFACLWSTRWACWGVCCVAGVGIVYELRQARTRKARWTTRTLPSADRSLWLAGGGLALLGGLPPLAAGDSLVYHLPVVTRALEQHRLRFWPEAWRSTFPQSHEMLAVFVAEIGGDRAGWITGFEWLLVTGLLVSLSRRWLGDRCRPWLAVMIAAGGVCPLGLLADPLKPDALVLVGVTLGALAISSVSDRPAIFSATLVGLAAGICMGAKYAALPVSAVLLLALLVQRRSLFPTLVALGVALGVGGVWYVRNLCLHGNPVAPYGSALLPSFLSPMGEAAFFRTTQSFGRGRDVWHVLTAPVAMLAVPDAFGGRGSLFSPLCWLGVGAVVVSRLRVIGLPVLGAAALLYLVWTFTLQNPRLLLPIVFPLSVLAAGVIEHWRATSRRWLSRIALWSAAAGLIPGLLVVGVPAIRYLALDRREYLRRSSPLYDDVLRIDATLGARDDVRVLAVSGSLALLRHSALSLSPYLQSEILPEELTSGRVTEVLARHHITHVYGTGDALAKPPWSEATRQWDLLWRNPSSRLSGTHLLRAGPTLETQFMQVNRRK
jgi:hypothetical protein